MNWLQETLNGDNVYDLIVDIDSQTPTLNLGWKLALNDDEEYYNCALYIPVDKVFHSNNITFNYSPSYDCALMCYKYGDKELNIYINYEECSIINKEQFNITEVYVYNDRYQSIQTSKDRNFNLYYNNVLTTKMDDGNLHSIIFYMKELELNSIYVSNDFKLPQHIKDDDTRGVYKLGTKVEVYDDALKCYNIYGKCQVLTLFFQHLVDTNLPLTSPGYGEPAKIIVTNLTENNKMLCDTFNNAMRYIQQSGYHNVFR